jgi:uncharacterized protein YihD (DUF1040 family)
LPISHEFKEKLTKHIIVYDDAKGDVEKAKRIIAGQRAFLKSLSHGSKNKYEIETIEIDEDNYASLLRCVQHIKQASGEYSSIYLNATDGLSSIAIVLSSSLLDIGAKVIAYDRYANTYNLHTKMALEKHSIKNNMDIASHLMLKGYVLLNRTEISVLNKRKDVILELAQNLTELKSYANLRQNNSSDKIQGFETYKTLLKSIGQENNQTFVQGIVFEEYIYHLIVDNFDFDDVWTGVKVEFEEDVKNEFDVLMIKDNHLHTIECKLVSGLNGEHFVYKTELIMEYLDDDGKAMILSIGADNERTTKKGKKRRQFSLGDKARANYGDIHIHQSKAFNEKNFLDDVREWFL